MAEYRQDLVTGDWVINAPERARRPHDIRKSVAKRVVVPKTGCPFEDLKKTGNWPPMISMPNEAKWEVVVIPNKYPAVTHGMKCAVRSVVGPYETRSGIGAHDVVVLKDHNRPYADLTPGKAVDVLRVIRERYRTLAEDSCFSYAIGFHNWGPSAGASLYHPHFQILALPVIPNEARRSLSGSHLYVKEHNQCAHCAMLTYEKRHKGRIVCQNKEAIAICPFASRKKFEIRIFPKTHIPNFEDSGDKVLIGVAEVLQKTLKMVRKNLHDPDLNFYIHGAPLKNKEDHSHYHWHIEVMPNVPPPEAGFELGTGVEINMIDPDFAATLLRGRKK